MRKIDKSEHLATAFFDWLSGQSSGHGPYQSSSSRYYEAVKMNLLHCQRGLCAYTEVFLGERSSCSPENWQEGRYQGSYSARGTLDHFDATRKQGEAWAWDNFFLVDAETNRRKGQKPVDEILKPDRAGYSPFHYLAYDAYLHIYFPHPQLTDPEKERVREMILTLGLNWDPVVDKRKHAIIPRQKEIEMGFPPPTNREMDEAHEFPTALRMSFSQRKPTIDP